MKHATAALLVPHLASIIGANRFHYSNENDLQLGLAEVLRANGITLAREVRLSGADRIDFLVTDSGRLEDLLTEPCVGIEVKVGGSRASLCRQVERYAYHAQVAALLVVTNRAHHDVPALLNGKLCVTVQIGRVA